MTPLHQAVAALAGNRPALVMSDDAFKGILLNNFANTVGSTQNQSVPLDGFPKVEVRFQGLSTPALDVVLNENAGIITADIGPNFVADFSVHFAGDPLLEFSKFSIDVKNLHVIVSVAAPNLVLSAPDYDAIGTIAPAPTRLAALTAAGISEEEIGKIEGALAFVMPRRVVNAAFSNLNRINLADHFTALDIRGEWSITRVIGGIVVIPSGGMSIKSDNGCPTQDSLPDFKIGTGVPSEIGDGKYTWPITPGGTLGPVVQNADDTIDGFASFYAPHPVWEERFSKTMPAIVYKESDNGFIGYDLTFTAELGYLGLRIDPARYGVVVNLSITASGFMYVTVDVPCVGRSDLGYARFSVSPSDLSILISFAISKEGKLVLRASIDRLNIGQCEANVSLFSRWLALAGGKTAVLGFIIDYVLKRVLQHNIPIKLRDAIKNEVNSKNFKLLDLEGLSQYLRYGRTFNTVTFSGDAGSLMVGLTVKG